MKGRPDPTPRPTELVQGYLHQRIQKYRELAELQKQVGIYPIIWCASLGCLLIDLYKGWESKKADTYFQTLQKKADHANLEERTRFLQLMQRIGDELHRVTSALSVRLIQGSGPAILDLCMAPGGFSMAALRHNPNATLHGISLPQSQGGHPLLIPDWENNPKITVDFRDITMLAVEMGLAADLSDIPASHPDRSAFSPDRPFQGMEFDLVLADGQVLRTHPRLSYRDKCEELRLLTSQLVLALQRVRHGGTIVVLLHRIDSWRSVRLMHTFAAFSNIQLFKPRTGHAIRTSFYLVARNIRPSAPSALEAVAAWKEQWKASTLEEKLESDQEAADTASDDMVNDVMDTFGPTLARLAVPVFSIQVAALRRAPFMGGNTGKNKGYLRAGGSRHEGARWR